MKGLIKKISELDIEAIKLIETNYFADERGSNVKIFSNAELRDMGIDFITKEILAIHSYKNVLRGLHFQAVYGQSRIVTCLKGSIFLAIVDVNPGSKFLGRNCSYVLDKPNKYVYIPDGYAVGTYAMEDADFLCICGNNVFKPQCAKGVIWNDSTLHIKWPFTNSNELIISRADQSLPTLNDLRKELDFYEKN